VGIACFLGFHRWRRIQHGERSLGVSCTRGRHAPRVSLFGLPMALAEAASHPPEEVPWGWEGEASSIQEVADRVP
jgi:hypothetical protein